MLLFVALLAQAAPPPEATTRVRAAHDALGRLTAAFPDSVWPEFRPDTIPVLYVVPNVGTYLLGWRGRLPDGFAAPPGIPGAGWQPTAARGAASTGTTLVGRPTAQVVVRGDASVAELVGLTAHEAFHVFQSTRAGEGRRFGAGENSFLVSSYPVFDVVNEAEMALEGRLLKAALDSVWRNSLLREFVAVREARQRRLESQYATFEQLSELNEGLAEYVFVRTLQLASRDGRFPWAGDAERLVDKSAAALDSLTGNHRLSIRLRFYATGPAQARLLDELIGPTWKTTLVQENLTLQELVARAAGARAAEWDLRASAARRLNFERIRDQADSSIGRLRSLRRAQSDSLLGGPGVQLTIALDSLPSRRVGLCMIDPQNLLQADSGVLLHTRAVRMCAGAALDASFTTPVVHDSRAGTIRAVIGPGDSLRVTTGGKGLELTDGLKIDAVDVRIETPSVTLRAGRASLELHGRRLTLRPK